MKTPLIALFVPILTAILLLSCSKSTEPQTCANPVFSQTSGTYNNELYVTISCETPGAVIRYTTNGSDPTESSNQYNIGITINSTTTLKAKAFKSGWNPSQVATANYIISIQNDFAGGTGSASDPYLIQTASQLDNVRNYLSSSFKLVSNISLSSYSNWSPIGQLGSSNNFRGSFNGNGYTISNLTIIRPSEDFVGLFGYCAGYATSFTNVVINNVNITGRLSVGSLAGLISDNQGNVQSCGSSGTVRGLKSVGGLIGTGGNLSSCWSACNVYGDVNVGGLTGNSPSVSSCYATGNIFGTNGGSSSSEVRSIGGLAGTGDNSAISNSYATGSVTGSYSNSNVGGLVGQCVSGTISNCYAVGQVTGSQSQYTGGISGWSSGGYSITYCYWNTETSGTTNSYGGTGKTTSQMIQQNTFSNWSFSNVWSIINGSTYPYLSWQGSPGSFNYPPSVSSVATPTFTPSGGTYSTTQNVSISTTTPNATIRYTTNGSEPTSTSTVYSSAISVSQTTTIKAKAFRDGWTPSATASATYTIGGGTPGQMIAVAGGTFHNGTSNVTLSSFHIGKYEVTQAEYQAVMGTNPSYFSGNPNRPVERVSWFNAIEYCNRRSMQEGLTPCYSYSTYGTNPSNWPAGWNTTSANHTNVSCNWSANGYRLPTEMEWMYAAKGGNQSQGYTYSGSNTIGNVAWYYSNSSDRTWDVGLKDPNELGTFDMSGNVWEWVWDIYGSYPSGNQTNPTGPTSGSHRVFRGGDWSNDANSCTVSFRNADFATSTYLGFRVISIF